MKQGNWNGEPCEYEVIMVKVEKTTEFKMPWTEPFEGTIRQAVKVKSKGEEFIIDNEDGSGLEKLYNGGMWTSGHRSITECTELMPVEPEHWITSLNREKELEINKQIDDYWREKDPETFSKIEKMKASIPKFSIGK